MVCHLQIHRSVLSATILAVFVTLQLQSAFPATTGVKRGYELHHLVDELKYSQYLKEVLEILNADNTLQVKIHVHNITQGNLGEHLDKADEKVRTRLDETKRQELYRIRQLSEELKRRGYSEIDIRSSVKSMTQHLDLKNLAKFGVEDLRKLILEANAELALLDTNRRESFKEYEMHKHLEFDELVKRLNPDVKEIVENHRDTLLSAHRSHKPINMPASKDHLLKVWEERDRLNKENFNVKTFFHLHDLDGNGFLDEDEIKVLLEQEIQGYFDASAPDYDPREKAEELERMREYTFTDIDTDKDHLINLEEFIANSKRTGFDDHIFWESFKKIPVFTDEEYAAYGELNKAEVNRMIDEGLILLNITSGLVEHNPGLKKLQKQIV